MAAVSSEPWIVGNPAVMAEVLRADPAPPPAGPWAAKATWVHFTDSIGLALLDQWYRQVTPERWSGWWEDMGHFTKAITDPTTVATPQGDYAADPSGKNILIGGHDNAFPVNTTSVKVVTPVTFPAEGNVFWNRLIEGGSAMLAPNFLTGGAFPTRGSMWRNGVDPLNNRPFTVRFVYLKHPTGMAAGKVRFKLRAGFNLMAQTAPVDFYAATPTYASVDMPVAAQNVASPYLDIAYGIYGVPGATTVAGEVVNLAAVGFLFDDAPGGLVFAPMSRGGASLSPMADPNYHGPLSWQCLALMGMTHLGLARFQNNAGGYTTRQQWSSTIAATVAAARVAVPSARVVLQTTYDTATDPFGANALPAAEQGYADAARSDYRAVLLNLYAKMDTAANLINDTTIGGDLIHPSNPAGRMRIAETVDGLAWQAARMTDARDAVASVNVVEINYEPATPEPGGDGPGADTVTLTITSVLGAPIPDADVWLTSDGAGTDVVAGTKQTDSAGKVTFLLDAGVTYYLWMQKDGVNPILGESFVAVAD